MVSENVAKLNTNTFFMAQVSVRNAALGLLSGLIGGVLSQIVAYMVGVIAIAYSLREFFATLLAALTVLPLMLIFVVLIPTILIGLVIGLTSGTVLNLLSRPVSLVAAALFGLALSEIILSLVLPMLATSSNGDFLAIASNPCLTGIYGLTLGLFIDCIFRWISYS